MIVYTVVPVESLTNPSKMLYKLLAGIYAITLSIGLLGIFFGMWRYWAKIDDSKKWIKRASFVLLLLGFWWGSAIYCFIVYLPQVRRRQRLEA